MISRKTFFQWLFFALIPLFLIFLLLTDPFDKVINRNYQYFTLASLIITIYYYYFSFIRNKREWTDPFTFVFFFQAFFSLMGILVYELREKYWTNDPADMETVGLAVLLSLIGLLASHVLARFLIPGKSKTNIYVFNWQKLNVITWLIIILGNIASLLLYEFYTEIPLFASNVDASRIEIRTFSSGRGTLFILQLLLVLAIPLGYLEFMKKKRKHWRDLFQYILQFLLCFIPLMFYGGRFYFLTPILLVIITHSVFIKKISLRQASYLGIVMLLVAIGFVTFRIFGADLNIYMLERAAWADFFPEIRSFGYVAYRIPSPEIYPKIITNFLVSFFPSAILGVFNINKELFLFSIGDYVASILGTSVPIRLGLIGEAFIAYGMQGIAILYFCLGLLLSFVSRINGDLQSGDCRRFLFLVIGAISALTVPYGTNMFPTLFFCILFTLIIVLLASKTSQNMEK